MSSNQGLLRRRVFAALFVFLVLLPTFAAAAEPAAKLKLRETDWRTGELEIDYEGAIPEYTIEVYAATVRTDGAYEKIDSFVAEDEKGSHVTRYLENGQSVWYFIALIGPDGKRIAKSNEQKQTPPITAYIINWPDMLQDLYQMMDEGIRKAMEPSDDAQDRLKDAVDGLKDAVGGTGANDAGKDLQDAIDRGQGGMKPPITKDNGGGMYNGGKPGDGLPNPSASSGGVKYPNPDSGTATEMTIRFPYGVDMQGNLLYVQIFTKEQMDKMTWWGVVRKVLVAIIWVAFAVWIIQRFTPQLKA